MLVDATNAFNSFNRKSALLNIRSLCPPLASVLINTYRENVDLFIDGETLHSQEGTTQGDPVAMAMYALGTLPLISKLHEITKQVWYADDAAAGGKLLQLRKWWDKLVSNDPAYGYFPNAKKTWIIVKPQFHATATEIFHGSDVNRTADGKRHLGSALGSPSFIETYVQGKVTQWVEEVKHLATIAVSHPQATYAAFTHGLSNKWTHLTRTTPNIANALQPLEDSIRNLPLPAITGKKSISSVDRELFTLPARLGGLNITNPTDTCSSEYNASSKITASLVALICQQSKHHTPDAINQLIRSKAEIRSEKKAAQASTAANLYSQLLPILQRSIDITKDKGASTISQLLGKNPVAVQPQSFATEQRKDSELLEIIRYLEKKELPPSPEGARRVVLQSYLFSLIE